MRPSAQSSMHTHFVTFYKNFGLAKFLSWMNPCWEQRAQHCQLTRVPPGNRGYNTVNSPESPLGTEGTTLSTHPSSPWEQRVQYCQLTQVPPGNRGHNTVNSPESPLGTEGTTLSTHLSPPWEQRAQHCQLTRVPPGNRGHNTVNSPESPLGTEGTEGTTLSHCQLT